MSQVCEGSKSLSARGIGLGPRRFAVSVDGSFQILPDLIVTWFVFMVEDSTKQLQSLRQIKLEILDVENRINFRDPRGNCQGMCV